MNVFLDARFTPLLRTYPVVLADIGSRGGVRPKWRAAVEHLHVVECEADPAYVAPDFGYPTTTIRTGLYDRACSVPFYSTSRDAKSSILRPNPAYGERHPNPRGYEIVAEEEIQVDTLDSQLRLTDVPYVDFVKVDTQGTELAILHGADDVLRRSVIGVDVEVNFERRYLGQPLFADVDTFLRERGFLIFDLQRAYLKRRLGAGFGGPKGQLSHGKALYFRDPDAIAALVAGDATPEERKAHLLRAMAVVLVYGYADLAYELLVRAGDVFDAGERATAERAFDAARKAPPPRRFRGRARLARLVGGLHRTLDPPGDGPRFRDPSLGA